MPRSEQSTGVGLRQVYVAMRDDDGTIKILGSPAAGVAYCGIRARKSRALTIQPAEAQRITARGDDQNYHTFQEAPTDVPTGELRTQISDLALIALITSTKQFGSGDRRQVLIGTDKVGEEDPVMLWGSRKAIDSEVGSASYGQRIWQTYFVLNAYAFARPPTMEDSQIGEFVWSIACNNSAVDQYGRTMTEVIHGCTEGAYIIIQSRYKFFMDAFEGTGAQTTFTLTKGADVKHDVSTSPIRCSVAGVITSMTVDAVGVGTIAPAPADGAKIIVEYEYED